MDYYYGGRRRGPSVLETFSLYPVPYPLLVILGVVMLLLGVSSFLSYEEAIEGASEQMSWALLAAPLLIVLAIRWLSSFENPGFLFGLTPYDRQRRGWFATAAAAQDGESSPWGVLALVVLLLVLLSFQSSFREMWMI